MEMLSLSKSKGSQLPRDSWDAKHAPASVRRPCYLAMGT